MNTTRIVRKADNGTILVTGAAGQLGGSRANRDRAAPRASASGSCHGPPRGRSSGGVAGTGAEVVIGDLLEPADVYRVVSGCRRIYFGMSVSTGYLEATMTMAAVARELWWKPWSTCPK